MNNKSTIRRSWKILWLILILAFFGVVDLVSTQYFFASETVIVAEDTNQAQTNTTETESVKVELPAATATPSPVVADILPSLYSKEIEIPILMYHHIRNAETSDSAVMTGLSVSPAQFASHLSYIHAKGYQPISFYDVAMNRIPEKPVILTFDDAYLNFYENAYPLLLAGGDSAVLYPILNKMSGEYMTAEMVAKVARNKIEIGSHTLSHRDLSKLSVETLKTELYDSKIELEKITGEKVVSLCYPAGKYSDAVVEIARDSGYLFATTTENGRGNFLSPLKLKRYRMTNQTYISGILK